MSASVEIPKTVNPDLQKERKNASFEVEEFAAWWHGGDDKLKFKRELNAYLQKDMGEENYMMFYKSHVDVYDQAVRQAIDVAKKLRKVQQEKNPGGTDIWPGLYAEYNGTQPAGNPFGVQFGMVVRALKSQGTDEQFEEFGKRVENFNISAAYAQTELGHGTFLKGLETRADYDRRTEEFVLNTPHLTSYKWWPGGLGHSSNYCIVVANLYIDDEPKGVHMFFVQVRDEETNEPMPGVDVGDIGHRLGFYGVNNGFLGLKNVRVPRTRMLMRHAKVLKDGTYIKSPASVLTYFTMVYVRCWIVKLSATMLAQAATIATRYSAVRRQSPINPGQSEPQIMDHVTQQMKLFPEIAASISYSVAFNTLYELFETTSVEIEKGEYNRLPEMHALSCAMKALSSSDSASGIERLRLSCGGHGYLSSSNFGNIYVSTTAACTYEGENTVLLLQTGRFLIKSWKAALQGKMLVPTVAYLKEVISKPNFGTWSGSWQQIVKALQYACAGKTRLAFESVNARLAAGQTEGEAANNTGIELTQAAQLYGRAFACGSFLEDVVGSNKAKRSAQFNTVLENLLELYLVHILLQNLSDVLRFVHLTDADIRHLQSRLEEALKKIRPDAVAICDGFDYDDRTLSSTLGSYDGNVYERLFAAAKQSPLNQKHVQTSFHQYLKPLMKSKL